MKKIVELSTIIVAIMFFAKCTNNDTSSKKEISNAQDTLIAQKKCLADTAWFPITKAPLNFNPDSLGECGFYQWAWQTFL